MQHVVPDTGWLEELAQVLVARGLLHSDAGLRVERLTGGVSSDIWALSGAGPTLVVKRALTQLRVAQVWRAPVSRNAAEAAWLSTVHGIDADFAPAVLYHDAAAGLFVMPYIPPDEAPVWKAQLLSGRCDVAFAAEVGRRVGGIHMATAGDAAIAARFANAPAFHELRLSPYLEAAAARHPVLAPRLIALAEASGAARDCLIHGDVSPKNILMGRAGPILLDAECATYGDAAFDLAFCLNHLLLKALRVADRAALQRAFEALAEAYFAVARFAPRPLLEARAAALLPGLLLARVDGKSPVEYIDAEAERDLVRAVAARFLAEPADRLADICAHWSAAVKDQKP